LPREQKFNGEVKDVTNMYKIFHKIYIYLLFIIYW